MRKPQVTRTITTTKATVLCIDLVTEEPYNDKVTLPRTYSDQKKLMAAVSAKLDTETRKAVHVVNAEVVETLYGMSEDDFIAHAEILPPRKSNETTDNDKQ